MDPWNMSISPNCTVDTSYRFTYFKISYSLIFIFGVVSNATALRRFCRMPRTITSTAVYMANLAAADIFFVISLPLRIYYHHNKAAAAATSNSTSSWSPGSVFCQATFTLKYISLYGGIFFLVCIGLDRYFAVVHPLLQHLRKVRTARMLSACIWCLVLALSLALPFLRSAASRHNKPCLPDPSSKRNRTIILVALGLVQIAYLLPALLLLFSYCSILHRLPRRRKIRHRHTLIIIYWVLGVFFLCFTPYHLNLLGYTLTQVGLVHSCSLARVTKTLHPVVLSLASTNCCLNPLIYYFSSSLVHREGMGKRENGSL